MAEHKVEVNHLSDSSQPLPKYNHLYVRKQQTQVLSSSMNYEFDNFFMGKSLITGEMDIDEHYEPIRKMVEKEDITPNFQIMIDSDGGFGYFAEQVIDELV